MTDETHRKQEIREIANELNKQGKPCCRCMDCKTCKEAEQIWEERQKKATKDKFCELNCGSGHVLGCPRYSSGHSIDVNGNCNMGCC